MVPDPHTDLPVRSRPRQPRQRLVRREYVCIYCTRGQCARCNDRTCTCCYGNED